MTGAMQWSDLAPQFEWRRSQAHLLDLASHVGDRRWHLCAPPGAGKTLIGLELARRLAVPTLVLSPTTAVRDQWRAATAMFGAEPATFTSDALDAPAPLWSVTYQLLGNPGAASDALRDAARRLWVADLTATATYDDAEARVRAIEQADPDAAARELRSRTRRIRRSLQDDSVLDVPRAALLGARADALIDHLVALDIGCVVLDECHHLLDWWALVITELVDRLAATREVAIIGLTATLPDPSSERETANYEGLLGPVDAELHIPALVAEGALAPWRDGVVLVAPTPDEVAFLDDIERHFADDLDALLAQDTFVAWAVAQVLAPTLDDTYAAPDLTARITAGATVGEPKAWRSFWDRDPLAAAAVAAWWASRGIALPAGFDAPGPIGSLDVDARLRIIDAWLVDPVHPCPDAMRDDLRATAERYGVAFTSAGPRAARSAADIVAARSTAKGDAAANVLDGERRRRGDGLRALVVVERDQAASAPAAARALLGEDGGTTARVLAALCRNATVIEGGVAAVTGRGAWVDAVRADAVMHEINVALGPSRSVTAEGTDIDGVVRLVGRGEAWSSATWLDALDQVFTAGVVHVLVGTRGLVGEGWDCPAINVLVDASEAATRTTVTQLRGRAIRRDPHDSEKVVSLWDVAVVHPSARGEWHRLQRKHAHWWGPDRAGAMTTGIEKIDARLDRDALPSASDVDEINASSVAAMADTEATRATWARVDPGGDGTPTIVVRRGARRARTVRTRSARATAWTTGAGIASVATVGGLVGALTASVPVLWPVTALATATAVSAGLLARARVRTEPATLRALGEAIRDGIAADAVPALAGAIVHVDTLASGECVASIEGPEDAAGVWADALRESLGPVGSPRWIVAVDPSRAWRVPAVVGATRVGAEAFAAAFARRVAGARLVRAGTPEATAIVLEQARVRPESVVRRARWRSPRA